METEKMAFWLDKDIKEKLKILAVKERRTASDIVRELLREYLKISEGGENEDKKRPC